MFRLRRYRVYMIFAIIALGALYHFSTIDSLEGAGAAGVERLKHFGPVFDSSKAKEAEKKASQEDSKNDSPAAVPSQAGSDHHATEIPATSKPASLGAKGKENTVQDVESSTAAASTVTIAKAKETDKGAPQSVETVESATKETGSSTNGPKATVTAEGGNPIGHPKTGEMSTTISKNGTSKADSPADPIIDAHGGDGRLEVIGATGKPKIHWTPLPEHFPVPTEMIIQLPTGKPKPIPKVQFDFKKETSVDHIARVKKLDAIREAFSFSWSGYRKKAWMQDELSPLSGNYRNPFCGWGATLVDSLDTLWMMDLKEEFAEAVEAVKDIDFTTSIRNDIPLFETVIRYLGGLVAAYDVSEGIHRILLDKAVELAEILMGAFDTPNRMPMTYYHWKPTFASQPHRAKTRVVLAELGSLSMEFTRLAQITKESKYYDAIARITNELEILQPETKVPGLWPQNLDASGCKKPDLSSTSTQQTQKYLHPAHTQPLLDDLRDLEDPDLLIGQPAKAPRKPATAPLDAEKPAAKKASGDVAILDTTDRTVSTATFPVPKSSNDAGAENSTMSKRDLADDEPASIPSAAPPKKKPDCEPQGLASPPYAELETFGMGGQADSAYEYLPKEYLLLGGLEEKYHSMYKMAANATRERLLYRPMIKDEERYILASGLLRSKGLLDTPEDKHNLMPEGTHLTCFLGGMFALGSKIFDIKEDLDIAKKLTDFCIWAYESTTTGIMPEEFETVRCVNPNKCSWNETLYQEKLDPYGEAREVQRVEQQRKLKIAKKEKEQLERQIHSTENTASASVGSEDPGIESTKKQVSEEADIPSRVKTSADSMAAGKADSSLETATSARSTGVTMPGGPDITNDSPKMALNKRQLGEIDEIVPTIDSSQPTKEKSTLTAKVPASSVSAWTKTVEDAKINPTATSTDSLKESQSPTSSAAATIKNSPNTMEHQLPGPAASTFAPTKSQADKIASDYEPPPIPSREEFVASRIKNERLPPGIVKISEKKYILRPEAIESVFIMYRATGDNYWREKGWKMFLAIEKYTVATYGASAIWDVTAEKPEPKDEMESFWLAETLKYFYLLYSDPSHISLDDYVLNTEAHPFKRPKP